MRLLASLACLVLLASSAFAQTNPPTGSVWTYKGSSIGPGWTGGCLSIGAFGGVGDGVTDTSGALTAALAAQGAAACVSFPPGRFKFAAPFSYTYPNTAYASIMIAGSGADVTELIGPANGNGLTFGLNGGFNSIHLRDFTLSTPSACSACTGIAINQLTAPLLAPGFTAQSDIVNVSLYGTDRSPTTGLNYWGNHIVVTGVSNVNFYDVYMQGLPSNPAAAQVGIRLVGPSASVPPVVFNMFGVSANVMQTGIEMGCYVQGVTVNQSSMIGDKWGIHVVPGCTGSPQSQLTVSNSNFNNLVGINADAAMGGVEITNNQIIVGQGGGGFGSAFYGINFGPTVQYVTVTGNMFNGGSLTNTVGIGAATAASNTNTGIITGNQFNNMAVGIALFPTAIRWTVGLNSFLNVTTSVAQNDPYGNYVANSVTGAAPTFGADCGGGASVSGNSTDGSGTVVLGTSPGTQCTITFSKPFVDFPRCFAANPSSGARPVAAVFTTNSATKIAPTTGVLTSGDNLQYHCDGYQ